MRHQDLQINHRLESWVYANAAARTGATGFVPGDVGRIAYQNDNGSYWRLTDDSPVTWQVIAAKTYASLTVSGGNPTATTSTTGVMMGLGGPPSNARITPTATGKIMVTIEGLLRNTVAGNGANIIMAYGIGTAPVNGAASTGSNTGAWFISQNLIAAGNTPFTNVTFGQFTVGVNYWFDAVVWNESAGGTASIINVVISGFELP